MLPQNIPQSISLSYRPFHGCAFQHPSRAKKPYSFWFSDSKFSPCGTTGTGLCEQKCLDGFRNEKGMWEHAGKLGRLPKDGPRGPGAIRIKNALPPLFVYEYLRHCVEHRTNAAQDVVIDLCCGWQSLKPVCEELGLHYIGVDIMGDRNRFLPIQARFKNKDGARVGGPRW